MTRVKITTSVALTLLGLGLFAHGAGDAHAGIIVTVGKPSPEICREKDSPYRLPGAFTQRIFYSDGTGCVELPDGEVECGQAIQVESPEALPREWQCVEVSRGVLWCENAVAVRAGPSAGGSSGPARLEGTPATQAPTIDSDPELMALGCGAGGLSNLVWLLGGLPFLWLRRR